ncbi:hypothetical protein RN001_008628 [Aquatica leii]|uniref:Uncharacterized protein n=1 Tax=Aquatica leii TaxID=1421715 RepID=A0AAN7P9V6_9COLE|nr:hypothetical protein RN001_008628 [Aquatica leii]
MKTILLSVVAFATVIIAAPQHGPDHNAVIVKYNSDNLGFDGYNYGYETSNKISHQETGQLVNPGTEHESMSVRGQYSYLGVDGVLYTRTTEQLRKGWENMKSRRKKKLANEKVNRIATGGGSYTPPVDVENAVVDDVLDLVDIEIKDSIESSRVCAG